MIDDLHGNNNRDAGKRFQRNKSKFVQDVDYLTIESGQARQLGITAPNGVTLLTESGYLKLVKTFTDDLAWQVQTQLVDCYFHVKQQITTTKPSNLELSKMMLAAIEDADRKAAEASQQAQVAHTQAVQATSLAQRAIDKVDHMEAALTTRTEEFCTIAGYCKINDLKFTSSEMSQMGKRCRKASEANGIQVRDMFDPRWGRVGLYHMSVLKEIFTPAM
jgi:hypothetical protein